MARAAPGGIDVGGAGDRLDGWLEEQGLGALRADLEAQGLSLDQLAELSPDELAEELGIEDPGLRARLWRALLGRRGAAAPPAPGSVREWLEGLGLGRHAPAFERAGVLPEDLAVLGARDLRVLLGIAPFADRQALRRACADLRPEGRGVLLGIDLADLPFPVAHPLSFVNTLGLGPDRRLENLVFAAYQAVRVTALLLLADYLDASVPPSPRIDKAARVALRRPHWAEWTTLASHLARFWRRPPGGRASRFPHLVQAWPGYGAASGAPASPWSELLSGLPGLQGGQAASVHDAFWRTRNDLAHRRTTRTGDLRRDGALLARLAPALARGLALLFPPGEFTLLRRVADGEDGPRALRFHGPHADLVFAPERLSAALAARLDPGDVGVQVGTEVLPVHPFMTPVLAPVHAPEDGREAAALDLGLVDGSSPRGVELLGVRYERTAPEHLAALLAALGRKRIDLGTALDRATLWTQADAARAATREQLDRLRDRRWFRETYVARPDLDERALACLATPGRALLLLGEPGSGKSSLLAQLVERLSGEEDASDERPPLPAGAGGRAEDVVVFLLGRSDLARDEDQPAARRLADAVARHLGIQPGTEDLRTLCLELERTRGEDLTGSRRLVLVLDAVDEAPGHEALLDALDRFLPALDRCEGLRLVLSLRTSSYLALEARRRAVGAPGAGPFRHVERLHLFADPGGEDPVPYLEVRPFEPEEVEAAYARWQELGPERAALAPFESLAPAVRTLLRAPLLLHLFHSTYRGAAPVPSDLDERRLFADHLDGVCARAPGLGEKLLVTGERLLSGRRAGLTSEDVAALGPAPGSAPASPLARSLQVSPLESLLQASILVPASGAALEAEHDVAFVFAHARLAEQVLLRALRARLGPDGRPAAPVLLSWAREAAGDDARGPLAPYLAGLELLVAERAAAGDGEALGALLALERPGPRAQLVTAGLEALAPLWGPEPAGAAGPAAVLATVVAAANGPLAGAFLAATQALPIRLARAGASPLALAIAEGRRRLLEALRGREPADLERTLELTAALTTCADLGAKLDRQRDPTPLLRQALALLEEAEAAADDEQRLSVREQRAFVASQLAFRLARARQHDEAWRWIEEATAIRRAALSGSPADERRRKALAFVLNQAAFAVARSDPGQAKRLYEEALGLVRPILEADPRRTDVARIVAYALSHLPDVCLAAGDPLEAGRHAQDSLEVARAALEARPRRVDLWRTLAYAHESCARAAAARPDGAAVVAADREAIRARREVCARDPGRADYRGELVKSLRSAAGRADGLDPEAARGWRAEADRLEPEPRPGAE